MGATGGQKGRVAWVGLGGRSRGGCERPATPCKQALIGVVTPVWACRVRICIFVNGKGNSGKRLPSAEGLAPALQRIPSRPGEAMIGCSLWEERQATPMSCGGGGSPGRLPLLPRNTLAPLPLLPPQRQQWRWGSWRRAGRAPAG